MAVKTIKYTTRGTGCSSSCLPCEVKDVYICLSDSSSIVLLSGERVFPAELIDSCTRHKIVGEHLDYQHGHCGSKSYHYPIKIIEKEVDLTLRYNSSLFTDPTIALAASDILGVSTDICTLRAAASGLDLAVDETITTLTLDEPNALGGRTFAYVSEDSTITTFNDGFSSVAQAVTCADVGVGSDRMVRDVSLNGAELVVDAAPEHTTEILRNADNPDSSGTYAVGTHVLVGPFSRTITNNTCRDISLYLTLSNNALRIGRGAIFPREWNLQLQYQIDGGGYQQFSVIGADQTTDSADSFTTYSQFLRDILPVSPTLAPGASVDVDTRMVLTVVTGDVVINGASPFLSIIEYYTV